MNPLSFRLALRGLNENGFFFLAKKKKRNEKCRHTHDIVVLFGSALCGMLDLMASINFYLSWWVAIHGSPRAIRMFTLDVPSSGKIERKEFRFGNFPETHTRYTLTKQTTLEHLKILKLAQRHTTGVLISRLKQKKSDPINFVCLVVCVLRKQLIWWRV